MHLKIHFNLNKDLLIYHSDTLDIVEAYWEWLRILNQKSSLIVFDDWNEIFVKDRLAFTSFIEDILERLPKIKIIICSIHSATIYKSVNNRVLKVKELSNKHTLELLKLSSESLNTFYSETNELIENYSSEKVSIPYKKYRKYLRYLITHCLTIYPAILCQL